jgi:tripeptidyl-peptidase-1
MRFFFVSAVLATLAIPALTITLQSSFYINYVVYEKRDTIQKKWVHSSELDPDHVLLARIGLKQSNLDLGMDYLMEM